MKLTTIAPGILSIDNFCSEAECASYIALALRAGFEPATVETEKGQQVLTGVRNNERAMVMDVALAAALWERLRAVAPAQIGRSNAVGLNKLFRFYRYGPGQEFRRHRDQSFIRNEAEASYYTFLIYLNEGYEGGETTFGEWTVRPRRGSALLFLHQLEHAGSPVINGEKLVLRSDVMYRLNEED